MAKEQSEEARLQKNQRQNARRKARLADPAAKQTQRDKLKRRDARRKERLRTDPVYKQLMRVRARQYTRQWVARKKLEDPTFQPGRDSRLNAKYGISIEDYNILMEAQDGKCGICGLRPSPQQRVLAVDHDHETGYIRGLLCHGCNPALGLFKHDSDLLLKAIQWIAK